MVWEQLDVAVAVHGGVMVDAEGDGDGIYVCGVADDVEVDVDGDGIIGVGIADVVAVEGDGRGSMVLGKTVDIPVVVGVGSIVGVVGTKVADGDGGVGDKESDGVPTKLIMVFGIEGKAPPGARLPTGSVGSH